MSTFTHQMMTFHHVPSVLAGFLGTLRLWRHRIEQRRELLQWSDRDIRDAGCSVGEVLSEARKPFWLA
ncbi:MAG: DUF1127 domain-containing protein [Tardiphaga sp.]|jgi:uncharacterized protein YjiS (DUF1127 family)|nr:DUF1127 domain-containing protein [Tardiphaga sp.]